MKNALILILLSISIILNGLMIPIYGGQNAQQDFLPIRCFLSDIKFPLNAYQFQIDGFSEWTKVKIACMYSDKKNLPAGYALISKDGFLVDENGRKTLVYFKCGYGERVRLSISQASLPFSNKTGILFFTPYPLEVTDKNGHRLTITVNNIEGTEFKLNLTGFNPNEPLSFKSISCHEKIHNDIFLDEKGEVSINSVDLSNCQLIKISTEQMVISDEGLSVVDLETQGLLDVAGFIHLGNQMYAIQRGSNAIPKRPACGHGYGCKKCLGCIQPGCWNHCPGCR